mgnify:CR=1 FL=1
MLFLFNKGKKMETFLNEIISFSVITIVVLLLAYLTKKKEDQLNNKDKE